MSEIKLVVLYPTPTDVEALQGIRRKAYTHGEREDP